MQITPETPYSEIATNALTGLNAPSYEQLAEALEWAQDEIDGYGKEGDDLISRIDVLEKGLHGALETLEALQQFERQGDIELAPDTLKMIGDGIEAVNKLW